MSSDAAREHIARGYRLFLTLLTGILAPLQSLQRRYRFVTINGIARTGGSYLTAELYRALGNVPEGCRICSPLSRDCLARMAALWQDMGLGFPLDEICACW